MADNSTLPATGQIISTDELTTLNGGAIVTGEKVQRMKVGFGSDGVLRDVDAANGLPVLAGINQITPGVSNGVQITALTYPSSTVNNSSVQLAAGATFTGGIETVLSLQAAQVMIKCDQPYNVFIDQFIDLAGTQLVATYTFTRLAGVPLNENVTLPGNYMRVRVTNTGAAATTTFVLETTFGIMDTQPNTLSNFGNLRVVAQENGVVSTVNSTTVNLAANAVFTGASEDVSEFSMIMVGLFSSHASATDGFSLQQSSDGVNWDFTDVFTVPAATGKSFSFAVQQKFLRIVYTNGPTLTTALRIQTLYSRAVKKPSSVRPQDGRANDNDFEESLSYQMLWNGTTWDRQRGDATNGMRVNTPPSVTFTATAAAATAVTATLPLPGVGLFHYITGIEIMRTATAALTGTAALVVTTTNIPGGLAWTVGNAMVVGATQRDESITFDNPIKSTTANTATTVAAPAPGAGVIWRINVYYYTGP